MPWEYFTVILDSPYQSCEGIFFTLHHENLVRFLKGRYMKLWALVKLSSIHFLTCMPVHTYLPSIQQNYHLSVPTSSWLYCLFPQVSSSIILLYYSGGTCSLNLRTTYYSLTFISLMDPRKVIDFQFFQSFFLTQGQDTQLQALYMLKLIPVNLVT